MSLKGLMNYWESIDDEAKREVFHSLYKPDPGFFSYISSNVTESNTAEIKAFLNEKTGNEIMQYLGGDYKNIFVDWIKASFVAIKIKECTKKPDEEFISKEFIKMWEYRKDMQKDVFTWQLFFAHISQSIFVNFEMLLNSLPMVDKDINIAKAKALLEAHKYFKITGGLIKVCIKLLEGEMEKLCTDCTK